MEEQEGEPLLAVINYDYNRGWWGGRLYFTSFMTLSGACLCVCVRTCVRACVRAAYVRTDTNHRMPAEFY